MSTRTDATVVGFGELVYDHVFVERAPNEVTYEGSRGGGPVWNVLTRLAMLGVSTAAVGARGDDEFGELAAAELADLGVRTERVTVQKDKRTRLIFESLEDQVSRTHEPRHTFRASCPVCGFRPERRDVALANAADPLDLSKPVLAVCFDRVSQNRVRLANTARAQGIATVLDLGRLDYLRYQPVAQLVTDLAAFTILFMPERVAQSLFKRLGRTVRDVMLRNDTRVLCISRGAAGAEVNVRTDAGTVVRHDIPAVPVPLVSDSAGAGDAFLAQFLYEAVLRRGMRDTITDAPGAAASAATAAARTLDRIGARSHVPIAGRLLPAWLHPLRGNHVQELRARRIGLCLVCKGAPVSTVRTSPPRQRARFATNAAHLLRRVLFSLERGDAITKCRDLLARREPVVAVGTGGSYAVAEFISRLLRSQGVPATAQYPADYAQQPVGVDTLVVVSYSGATSDCAAAIRAARTAGVARIALVTASQEPRLRELLNAPDSVIAYGSGSRERGFVSTAGTVAPCALFAAALSSAVDVAAMGERVSTERWDADPNMAHVAATFESGGVVHGFGSGLAWPTLCDLESKCTEGGLGTVQLHDSKDFSHGRFMLVFGAMTGERRGTEQRRCVSVMATCGALTTYETKLQHELAHHGVVVSLASERRDAIGALETLLKAQYAVAAVAQRMRIDISRPTVDQRWLGLYRFRL